MRGVKWWDESGRRSHMIGISHYPKAQGLNASLGGVVLIRPYRGSTILWLLPLHTRVTPLPYYRLLKSGFPVSLYHIEHYGPILELKIRETII